MKKPLHPVHNVYDGLFNSASGLVIDLNNPTPDMICLEDIAAALSKICRFGGHTNYFYSVAQHSLLVAQLAPKELELEALMHDAAEAYLGDVIKPLKVLIADIYTGIENKFMDCIIEKFNLDRQKLEAIKPYDMEALELEHNLYQLGNTQPWLKAPIRMQLKAWHPMTAEVAFIQAFNFLQFPKLYPMAEIKLQKAIGVNDLIEANFQCYEFTDKLLAAFGKPERNFKMLIEGREKNGKTRMMLELAKLFSAFRKVYINSHEEGKSKTLQDAYNAVNMKEVAGKVMLVHKEPFDHMVHRLKQKGSAGIIIGDSIDYMKMTEAQFNLLVDTFPRKVFIFITWTDPKGDPVTSHAKKIRKRVDIILTVKNRVGYPVSRFADGEHGNKPIYFGDTKPPAPQQPKPSQSTLF